MCERTSGWGGMARGVMTLKAVVTTITVMAVITMIVSMFLVLFSCLPMEFHIVSYKHGALKAVTPQGTGRQSPC